MVKYEKVGSKLGGGTKPPSSADIHDSNQDVFVLALWLSAQYIVCSATTAITATGRELD